MAQRKSVLLIPSGLVSDNTKKFNSALYRYDDVESGREKKMSINKSRRNSFALEKRESMRYTPVVDNTHPGRGLAGLSKLSMRFGIEQNPETTTIRRGGKRSLKGLARKMMFTLRLKTKKKKLINVDENKNEIFEIVHINELSPLDIMDIWFSEAEMQEVKWDNEEVAAAMDNGATLEEADGRGLEHLTEEGNWAKYKMRKEAVNDVLDEFDRQSAKGILQWDMEKLRESYKETSEPCFKEAAERGQYDENAVIDYLQDTRKEVEEKWARIDQLKLKRKIYQDVIKNMDRSETEMTEVLQDFMPLGSAGERAKSILI